VAAALALCPLVAALAPGDPASALARGRALSAAEHWSGTAFEPALYACVSAHPALLAAARAFYVWVHLPALVGALVWVWLERRHAFALARDTFVATQVFTVAAYLAVPTAPPWLTGAVRSSAGQDTGGALHALQSPYAAMPSGHVAFAAVAGGMVAALGRPAVVRALACAYPFVVVMVVLATGNHLWLDAVGGAFAALLGLAVARRLRWGCPRAGTSARARPRRAARRRSGP
jgi:hypothetical protein